MKRNEVITVRIKRETPIPLGEALEYIKKCYTNLVSYDQLTVANNCCTILLEYLYEEDEDVVMDFLSMAQEEAQYKLKW